MNHTQARTLVLATLADVAPEIDVEDLDPGVSLRDGADLDSMDFLDYVSTLSEAIGSDIPEDDYGQVDTVGAAVAYLASRTA